MSKKLEIHAISDTHTMHNHYTLPGGDILIHAGDCTGRGTFSQACSFLDWFKEQDYSYLVLIPGNHDWIFEQNPTEMLEECEKRGIVLLNDSGIEIEGLKIWGSPIQPWFYDWAFNRFRGSDIKKHWDLIPKDTEILITHGPPFEILDKVNTNGSPNNGQNVGCIDLLDAIKNSSIKLHIFGHIHEGRGYCKKEDVLYINASSLDEKYKIIKNDPYVPFKIKLENEIYSVES